MLFLLLGVILGLQPLHEAGFRGEGKTIAVIDCGFYRANDPNVFDQSKIVGMYDLLPDSLQRGGMCNSSSDLHGTEVLSTMLYEKADFTGTAPDAHYILIRTEDIATETYAEVERLERGMLLADSLGADIITISLGYSTFDDGIGNFSLDDLDGTSSVSRTATTMARHGRLVLVAAGNTGNNSTWPKIMLPADADSILTVGATDSLGNAASFSGWGPTADGRVKPDVSAWGDNTRIYHPVNQRVTRGKGTSFATPEVAGMAACLWQALPMLSAMQLRELIIRSASLYPAHDDQQGYGVPDAAEAWQTATALKETNASSHRAHKIIVNGQVLILREGRVYTVTGESIAK